MHMTPLKTMTGLLALAISQAPAIADDSWVAQDGWAPHWFGYAVATDDGMRVSGAPMENRAGSQAGAAYVLDMTLPGGVETKVMPKVRNAGERFGWAVDIYEKTMVVGAPGSGAMTGHAYVFERRGSSWVQVAVLRGLTGHGGDGFGSSVAIEGDRILVGAPKDRDKGPQAGAVYVFQRGKVLWTFDQVLHSPHPNGGDQFGFALDMHKGRVVVGAFSANIQVFNEGAAYVYEQGLTGLSLQAELWADEPRPNSMFARSVGILGDRIAIGATEDHHTDVRTGSVSLYGFDGKHWNFEERLQAPSLEEGNAFGYSVALQPEGLVVGAPLAHVDGVRCGDAYVFQPVSSRWQNTGHLKAQLPSGSGDFIGVSVSIAEDGAVVGAMLNDFKAYNAGAVHMYVPEDYDMPAVVDFCGCDAGGSCGTDPQPYGCENSTGEGARLQMVGSPSLSQGDMVLHVSGVRKKSPVYFLIGEPAKGELWFDGMLCIGSTGRGLLALEYQKADKSGNAYTSGSLIHLAERSGLELLVGSTWGFQAVYYDKKGPCETGYNTTNGLLVTLME